MELMIYGTPKCKDTRSAERFMKERGVKYQFRDLNIKNISKKELDEILRFYSIDQVINKDGSRFKERKMEYMVYDIYEELLNDSLLIKTPIIRTKKRVLIGSDTKELSEIVKEFKNSKA